MKSILLDNIYFISPNGNNIDWNFLASVPIFFDFENLNLSFVDISDLEEKSLVQVKEFLLIKNIYEFFCSFINYQLIKRVLTIFASSYPIIKDLKTLEKIQFIFSTLPNENTISYQIRLNKTVINTSFNYLIEFDLLLNIRQFKESSEIFLMNFNYENYKEENLNILNAKGSDQIPALIDRNLILNSLKFKIKEVKETFLAIQKNHWNYNTSLIQMESWLKGLSLQDASLDFLKINAAIVYSLKLFLAQSKFSNNLQLKEEILLLIMTNNKVPKANILSKISDADLVLRKINLINKFSELLSTQSLDLTEFSQELNQLPVDIYSRELINKINKILSEIYLLPNGTLLYLEKKEIKQPRTKITRIIEFDNDDYLDEAKKREIIKSEQTLTNLESDKTKFHEKHREIFSRYENQSHLTRDVREAFILRNVCFNKKQTENIRYERSLSNTLESIYLEELKYSIFKKISEFKNPNCTYTNPLSFIFADLSNNKYFNDLLKAINISTLKELIKKVEINLNNNFNLKPILYKLNLFLKEWNIEIDLCESFIQESNGFNNDFIKQKLLNYLEEVFILINQLNLTIDEIKSSIPYVTKCIFRHIYLDESFLQKINNKYLSFSTKNFFKYQKEVIQDFFDTYYKPNLTKINNAKSVWFKLKEVFLNIFDIEFFISNCRNLEFFIKLHNLECSPESIQIIEDIFLTTKWWHFVMYGMTPFFLFNCDFKKRLSEKLFIYIANKKFNETVNIINEIEGEKNEATREKKYQKVIFKHIDELFRLHLLLKESNIQSIDDFTQIDENNRPQLINSRQDMINLFKAEALTEFLELISNLKHNQELFINEFTKLLGETLDNIKKLKQENNFTANHIPGRCLFKLSKNNLKKNELFKKEVTLKI